MKTRVALAILAVLATGCESSPLSVAIGLVEITPPPVYSQFWGEIEVCSGAEGDFREVRWFVARDVVPGSDILGRRTSDSEIIVRSDLWLDGDVVRHEILHQLLRGDHDHQSMSWSDCADIVTPPKFIREPS